jgi:hypothetical protein
VGIQSALQSDLSALGLYTWHVCENRLVADHVFAGFYGFTDQQVSDGVSVEEIMDRIMVEDRERVARQIHSAILSGEFFSTSYRVMRDGKVRHISSFGRCLKDSDGIPSHFTGALFEIAGSVGTTGSSVANDQ